jgi:hypothetical protein
VGIGLFIARDEKTKKMNRLLAKLDMRRYDLHARPGDAQEKVLKAEGPDPLTSNVKRFRREASQTLKTLTLCHDMHGIYANLNIL